MAISTPTALATSDTGAVSTVGNLGTMQTPVNQDSYNQYLNGLGMTGVVGEKPLTYEQFSNQTNAQNARNANPQYQEFVRGLPVGLSSMASSQPTATNFNATTTAVNNPTTSVAGTVSGFAAPYISNMLGKGMGLSNMPFTGYTGDLVAGPSGLQNQAFSGIAGLTTPDKGPMDVFTSQRASQYANPFVSNVVNPQLREAQRQAEIQRIGNAGKLVGAGAFGGSRQAIMEAEGDRNLQTLLGDITGRGYQQAFENAQQQFERDRNYGLDALTRQQTAGETQRGIEQQGLAADYEQYLRQFNYPKEQVQFQSDLLKNIPEKALTTLNTYGVTPSTLTKLLGAGTGILGLLSATNTLGGNTGGLSNIYGGIANLFKGFGSDAGGGLNPDDYEGLDFGDIFTGGLNPDDYADLDYGG